MIKKDYQLKYMSWPQIKNKMDKGYDTVIIVLASTEQHGLHLAECTDEIIGLGIADGLAERLGNALIAPPIIPGLSDHHIAFPGSLSLRSKVFNGIIEDYVKSYIKHGFKKFIFIPSHGGNMKVTESMVEILKKKYSKLEFKNTITLDFLLKSASKFEKDYDLPKGSCGGHACAYETSIMLYLEPELVDMEAAKAGYVGKQDNEFLDNMFKKGIAGISEIGVLGDPTVATAELGEKFFNTILDEIEKMV
ncbi:MAG: creatininase family protein [Bacillota bacterium]|nr:creatininase family protein [Bacillota bacterium]